ncbi:MAG: DUF1523 family protein [Methanobrevibacter sp.]|nr:DUF1523 family protein [Methanosphaera sp.]MBR0369195.1 DUF1523 family protein [Methanobrevibacter sp.]
MTFIAPTWTTGLLVQIGYFIIPLVIGIVLWVICASKDKPMIGTVLLIVCIVCAGVCTSVLWWQNYEVPSVQTKVVTVDTWQPKAGIATNENGMMVIDNADQLMLITTDGEAFLNEENFLFQKFDTRDILNELKPGTVAEIKYYGWREGFNSGFPNILSVEKIIDDSNAVNKTAGDYFGTRVI